MSTVRKLSLDNFIKLSKIKFGENAFNYDKCCFTPLNYKVLLKCNLCNIEILVHATQHLREFKHGCMNCHHNQKFIKKSKAMYGDKFNYNITKYVDLNTNISIQCNDCLTIIALLPNYHLNKIGCVFCNLQKRENEYKDVFIKKSIKLYGRKFDYSLIKKFLGSLTIEIKCLDCGANLIVNKSNHLNNKNKDPCQNCRRLREDLDTSKGAQFILKSQLIHKNKYSYINVDYKNTHQKVCIVCSIHNEKFYQQPAHHLQGQGCPICASNNKSKKENLWLDYLSLPNDQNNRQVKIIINSKIFYVDGFDPQTNTIYEFHGDYWHGNPYFKNKKGKMLYHPEKIHPKSKITYGELYWNTLEKQKIIEDAGYNLVIIWEDDWDKIVKESKL